MKVLGIDTSTKKLGIAILDGDRVLMEFNGKDRLRHSQDLIPKIEAMLKSTKLSLSELDGFAISIGPGSFTGLRIGVTTLKGLSLVTKKPVAAIPTLDVIASNITKDHKSICVILDAKKNKIYACIYARRKGRIEPKTEYLLITAEELLGKINLPTLFLGDGISLYRDLILSRLGSAEFSEKEMWSPQAKVVTKLGIESLKKGKSVEIDALVPMYLYSRECSIRGIDK